MISSFQQKEKKNAEAKDVREKKRQPPSLRYLATEILFKGYCIIFLMRFSSFPFLLFPFTSTTIFCACLRCREILNRETFPFKYTFEKKISKIMQVITFYNSLLPLQQCCWGSCRRLKSVVVE
jgi:hypothetical protein